MVGLQKLQTIEILQKKYIPMFEDFGEKIKDFYKRLDDMDDCIIKFDETLSLKANKSQLFIFDEKFNEFYDVRNSHEDLTSKVNFIQDKLEDTQKRIYDYVEEC